VHVLVTPIRLTLTSALSNGVMSSPPLKYLIGRDDGLALTSLDLGLLAWGIANRENGANDHEHDSQEADCSS
jgi:hypothetical protein